MTIAKINLHCIFNSNCYLMTVLNIVIRKNGVQKKGKSLKSKAESEAKMKQDLFEFNFELRLSDGLVEEQKKSLH